MAAHNINAWNYYSRNVFLVFFCSKETNFKITVAVHQGVGRGFYSIVKLLSLTCNVSDKVDSDNRDAFIQHQALRCASMNNLGYVHSLYANLTAAILHQYLGEINAS